MFLEKGFRLVLVQPGDVHDFPLQGRYDPVPAKQDIGLFRNGNLLASFFGGDGLVDVDPGVAVHGQAGHVLRGGHGGTDPVSDTGLVQLLRVQEKRPDGGAAFRLRQDLVQFSCHIHEDIQANPHGEDLEHVRLHDVLTLDVVEFLVQDGHIDPSGQDVVSGIGADDALGEILIQERPGVLRLEGPFIAVGLRKGGNDSHHSQQ